ncbi:hypothetical protein JOL79_16455 [Microbispora sp. RL4-1S]|uniref:DUF2304 domain-containing protein n=1 Tax=Microbispora oryzae TaxID=2806554 RepID=A0A940WLY4_9ACTN|nr:hypothetical protein [Microbispora oryzae]MBP2705408.1 hypothetical protein [Microbispora oryzae]
MSLVVVLGVAVILALRYMGLRLWQAALCVLFGFYLNQTAAAPEVGRMVSLIVAAISNAS